KINEGKINDAKEETILYLGPHPKFMKERIGNLQYEMAEEISIVEPEKLFSEEITQHICAKKVYWNKKDGLAVEPCLFERIFSQSKVPTKLKSPQARKFDPDMKLILLLSEK